MTVGELIAKLSKFDTKSQIVDDDGDDQPWDIELFIGGEDPEGRDLVVMRTNKG